MEYREPGVHGKTTPMLETPATGTCRHAYTAAQFCKFTSAAIEIGGCTIHTCESLNPSCRASSFLSGLVMYFCFWNLASNPFLCVSENTALRRVLFLGRPLSDCKFGRNVGISKVEVFSMVKPVEEKTKILSLYIQYNGIRLTINLNLLQLILH